MVWDWGEGGNMEKLRPKDESSVRTYFKLLYLTTTVCLMIGGKLFPFLSAKCSGTHVQVALLVTLNTLLLLVG